ncbi:MAG: hypothetical protein FWH43_05810 [Endomicrobia bacterium]|nr:hypothetical protein [Endomicrobiia bacterium]
MKNKIAVLSALFFLFSINLYAAQDSRALIKGLRPMSMGGAFTAVADDENAFFYNPAGITQRQDYLLQIFTVDLAVNSDINKFADFYSDNRNGLENFSDLSALEQAELNNKINNNILGTVPKVFVSVPNIAFISKPVLMPDNNIFSYGAGFFSYVNAQIQFNHSLFVPSLSYLADVTSLFSVPVSYRINSLEKISLPGKLSLGANFKYIYRGKAEDRNLSVSEFEDFSFPMQLGSGFGIDFGAIYHLNPNWNIGMQLSDAFYTKIGYGKFTDDDKPHNSKDSYTAGIRPEWNIGAAYFPDRIYYWPGLYFETNKRFTFAADITDLANDDETLTDSFWKKTHFGAEYKYSPFVVRAGFNSGYPAFGGGIVTNVVQFEYAFYGEEQGRYAGQDPSWYHRILFSVKIGADKGRPYGKTVKKAKALKSKESKKEHDEEDSNADETDNDITEDVKPAAIPKDAKETISKSSDITEVE